MVFFMYVFDHIVSMHSVSVEDQLFGVVPPLLCICFVCHPGMMQHNATDRILLFAENIVVVTIIKLNEWKDPSFDTFANNILAAITRHLTLTHVTY